MKFIKIHIFIVLFSVWQFSLSQEKNLVTTIVIPETLKENANIVIRKQHKDINIVSQRKIITSEELYITFLNESGWENFNIGEYYDKSDKIKSIEAYVYNALGSEIKKIKRSDFRDYSVADGFSVYTDNRMLSLDYTPTTYPFTIKYTSVIESINTAFIPQWFPVFMPFMSVGESSITVTYPSDLGFRYKEFNFENSTIQQTKTSHSITFKLQNFPAIKHEDYTPSFIRFAPYVRFALQKFHLEGVDGEASTWEEMGRWINNTLLSPTNDLPENTKQIIRELVKNEPDTRSKAEKIYKYVQDKTRYVSIQLGIGGWKPMNAKDVDRLGYGDCKALTNYTKALLESVGIPSFYSIIHNNDTKLDMTEDFVSMQGNHIILGIPDNDNFYWLECTSQTIPFGYIGDSNDDRLVLSINNDQSGLKRTLVYPTETNLQLTKAEYILDSKGTLKGGIEINTRGTQYGNRLYLERIPKDDIDKYYKRYFSNINNLKLLSTRFTHNHNEYHFREDVSLAAENYATLSGDRLIFVVNSFNQYRNVPKRYRKRTTPFEIQRGFKDIDEYIISIPEGYIIESIPNNLQISTKFGEYRAEFIKESNNKIIYKRSLITNEGLFPKEDYEDFRNFREQISRGDNSKIVLVKP